jgi:F-type H+-transporting ATPase subunit b
MGFLLLATEASAVHSEFAEAGSEHGFGLNIDILETNLINIAILVGVLFYFGRKVISNILNERRLSIEAAIQEAEQKSKEAAAALSDAQQKLTQSQAEAQRIRQAAEESAQAARAAILARAGQDVQRLKETAAQDLNTETERAIAQLRASVVAMALEKVESELQTQVDNTAQQQLIERSIALMGGRS